MSKFTKFQTGQVTALRADSAHSSKTMAMAMLTAMLAIAIACVPLDVLAQTTGTSTTDTGNQMWTLFKSVLFGGWGMLASGTIFSIAAYTWLRRGLGEAIVIAVLGFSVFFIPAMVMASKSTAQSLATSTN